MSSSSSLKRRTLQQTLILNAHTNKRLLKMKSWCCVTQALLYTHRCSVCDIMDCRLPMFIGFCLQVPQTPVTLMAFNKASIPDAVSKFRYEKQLLELTL